MADNTALPPGTGGDTIRDIDKGGIKTQVVVLDLGGTGVESLATGSVPVSGTVTVSNPTAAGLTDTQLRANPVPVSGTFYQATQPVSLASQPLPTGASTETTLAAVLAKLPTVGANTSANSQPVTIASDQVIPISQPLTSASGTITTQNLVPAGTATAGSAVEITLNGANALTIQTTGTYTGALSLQGTLDNATWVTMGGVPMLNINTGGYLASITSALQGIFQADVGGFLKARITGLAAQTGTATVTMKASPGAASMLALDAALPPGANAIGSVVVSSITANTPTLAAGTNSIGGVTQKVVATTPGATLFKVSAAATTNAAVVKASAGNVFQWQITNVAAYAVYVSWYNKATAPVPGTDVPIFQVVIPAGGVITMPHGCGVFFSTGIGISITRVDNTAIGVAGDAIGHALYA